MPDDLPGCQMVAFDARPAVVNHQRLAKIIARIRDNSGVQSAPGIPENNVARLPLVQRATGNFSRQALRVFLEKANLVGHAAMVDIGIGRGQAPGLRIVAEVTLHVFVNQFLQVEAGAAKSAHDDIGASAQFFWHVAKRISNDAIARVIIRADLRFRAL